MPHTSRLNFELQRKGLQIQFCCKNLIDPKSTSSPKMIYADNIQQPDRKVELIKYIGNRKRSHREILVRQ